LAFRQSQIQSTSRSKQ